VSQNDKKKKNQNNGVLFFLSTKVRAVVNVNDEKLRKTGNVFRERERFWYGCCCVLSYSGCLLLIYCACNVQNEKKRVWFLLERRREREWVRERKREKERKRESEKRASGKRESVRSVSS
jgi:hypothetical protein